MSHKKKIIHFCLDEKVVNQIIFNFSSRSNDNLYLIFCKSSTLKHVKIQDNVILVTDISDLRQVIIKHSPKAIIFHSMDAMFANLFLQVKIKAPLFWFEWGFDIYHLPKIRPLLYGGHTRKYIIKNDPSLLLRLTLKKQPILREIFYWFQNKKDPYKSIFNLIKNTKYFVSYIEEDFKFFSKFYKSNLSYINCEINSIDQYVAGLKEVSISQKANSILIGNSCTLESNHLDVLNILTRDKETIKGSKMHLILSYGENPKYGQYILNRYKEEFPKDSEPITQFMPREDYVKLLQKCSVGIFFHFRQQAMGNIIPMIYLGARIYLSKKNPILNYFRRNNLIVFDLETDLKKFGAQQLSRSEKETNKKIIEQLFSPKQVGSSVSKLLRIIN